MSDQYPDLHITLIEDDEFKAGMLAEKFAVYGADYLGRLASNKEVFAAFAELKEDPDAENLISRANVLFIDGNLGDEGGCGDGNQIIGALIRERLAYPPRYYSYAGGKPFPRVAYGCSMAPRNAFASALAGYNFAPHRDTDDKLHAMLAMATVLLRDGTEVEPAIG